ncbi:PadR family transcriptional regulator [Conexibacter woesei]|uniref:Transcriptional regulator, PadR-like family n=1 Tax=Conexibacter woesei (strain DSM 14684 / CCUG 47730 / CIP 108061 / JCM 11494 / NBRC 100937 / ID131577) TaxID=469383 RepID=D3F014_CONWI|nr:PadR family transcriptional regulator [Conexibacter woesei]ADB49990.1 transcriptional regulator, PadR-like family [Conexibacter woesei DSM 14684]
MRSTVNLAVLGLVIERPSYGYELSQRFGRRFGDLFAVGRSHIYAALDSLQRDSLIEPLPRPQPVGRRPRQPRVHYRVTADGARTYREWVAEQLRENTQRSQMLARLAVVGAGQTETIDLLLAGYELAARNGGAATAGDGDGEANGDAAERLVLRLLEEERRVMREAQQKWMAFARRELAAFDDDGS